MSDIQPNKIRSKGIVLFLIFLSISCITPKPSDQKVYGEPPGNQDMIVFFALRISKPSDSEKSTVDLISKHQSEGKIQNAYRASELEYDNYLLIETRDSRDNCTNTIIMEHPLYKYVESVNDQKGQLSTRFVTLNRTEFLIRLQTKSSDTKVVISEILKKGEKQLINIIIL